MKTLMLAVVSTALAAAHGFCGESVDALTQRVSALHDKGQYQEAIPVALELVKACEASLGPQAPRTAESLNLLGVLYYEMGDFTNAGTVLQRAISIWEKAPGPEPPELATALDNLGAVYRTAGNFEKAEPLHLRAVKLAEKTLGPDHPDTGRYLNDLAMLYHAKGDYAKAEPVYQRALGICEKARGADDDVAVMIVNNLGMLAYARGDYEGAVPLLRRTAESFERQLGPAHPNTAVALNNLAGAYLAMGDYAEAEPLFQRALKASEALGPQHQAVGRALNNLANLYLAMGNYAKALPLLERSLTIAEGAFGPDHPTTAMAMNNVAWACRSLGEYEKAMQLYRRALACTEKTLGPTNAQTAVCLDNLAELCRRTGDFTNAAALFQRAIAIQETALGPTHPETATTLDNLAFLYHSMGNVGQAKPLFERALAIRQKALGPHHPLTAKTLVALSFVLWDLQEKSEAIQLAQQAQDALDREAASVLSFASEQQRLEYQAHSESYSLAATLGTPAEICRTILHRKGVVLDSLLEDRMLARASHDTEARDAVSRIRVLKENLARLDLEFPKPLNEKFLRERATEGERLTAEIEKLEGDLGRRVAGLGGARRALSATIEEVQKRLPPGAVLVEMLQYGHYLGTNTFEPRYGAALLAAHGDAKWVVLGSAAAIERNVTAFQAAVRAGSPEPKLASLLRDLYQQVWAPVESALPTGAKTLVLSPDLALNFLSFAVLLDSQDKFLAQKYTVQYAASGRDLLRELKPTGASNLLVVANPDFLSNAPAPASPPAQSLVAMRSLETRTPDGVTFNPLPGTAAEAVSLEARAREWGWPVQVFLGAEASEANLRTARPAWVVHLATHGFFLAERSDAAGAAAGARRGIGGTLAPQLLDAPDAGLGPRATWPNPMRRSGLALAGAQTTLEAWKRGEVPAMDNDGILTAEEVGELNFEGTWLVVLSACDTGAGEARSGEGVLGLRRGFIQAGAQNLLMTLWPVTDVEVPQFMLDFYSSARNIGNAPAALAQVQREWLVRLRKERGLAEAVRLAGPFIMSSQGSVTGQNP